MKKILSVAVLVFAAATSGAFGQSTEDEWFKKANEYYDSGDYADAVTAYGEAIKRNSSNLNTYWFRSFAYFQIKNYDAAIADCDTVIKGAPDFPNVYMARGDAYGAKDIYHKSIADYQTGLVKGYDPAGFRVDKSSKADMWFCGAMYMEIAVNRFLGESDVVTKYENWLKTVSDKNGVTRAEVETFYRQNIDGLVAEAVDEEFNKISFLIENSRTNPVRDHKAVLTYNPQNGHYTLSYEGAYTTNGHQEITALTLEALLAEMDRRETDFDQTGINKVREQAALIPMIVYTEWLQNGVSKNIDAIELIKNAITDFYLNPNTNNYNTILGIYARYWLNSRDFYTYVSRSFTAALRSLSPALSARAGSDVTINNFQRLARYPSDSSYNVFSVPVR